MAGARPSRAGPEPARARWLYHHLTVTGPAAVTEAFAAAARGPGVIPWWIDGAALEEDVFNLAVGSRWPGARSTSRAAASWRGSSATGSRPARRGRRPWSGRPARSTCTRCCRCRSAILRLGPTHPAALAWLVAHWGIDDGPRHVAARPDPRPGRRLPRDHAVIGYGFFTRGGTPHAAIAQLAPRWPALRLTLQPRPD